MNRILIIANEISKWAIRGDTGHSCEWRGMIDGVGDQIIFTEIPGKCG